MPRTYLSVALRASVIARAEGRCEYCLIHQDDTLFSHHIDHFIPLKHGGQSVSENLVLSCPECYRYKGSDLSAIDPVHEAITPFFNPRVQVWWYILPLRSSGLSERPRRLGQPHSSCG
ncbi:MAG: HNH endonuclease [Desulfobulbaceae bacterium]|nr:HNH endonuclease [Desulfobulbaceae bacterium]